MTKLNDIPRIAEELIGAPSMLYAGAEQGMSPEEGFDCSGFVTFVLQASGVTIGTYTGRDGYERPIRHSNEYWDYFGVAVHDGAQLPGDLIFFSRNGFVPTHIGIVADDNTFIHAPGRTNTQVIREVLPKATPITPRVALTERQLYMHNPIGFKAVTCQLKTPNDRYQQKPLNH